MKFRRMSFVLCMLLFLVSGISAYAVQCELGVSLGEKGAGIELSVYKVADIEALLESNYSPSKTASNGTK